MEQCPLGHTGIHVSTRSFGASPIGSEFGTADPAQATRALCRTIDLGITGFDPSPYSSRIVTEWSASFSEPERLRLFGDTAKEV